eukprot:TRINITY_DN824_c0_g1_i1.p1 TRINITY_DN824_c0_g1~~TRINITY_DN824_c0_g1_i1.p1  ORF type:complete len:380 (-),score=52.81 TRINITY_DN824_c0_g1_i1:9-1148(-)
MVWRRGGSSVVGRQCGWHGNPGAAHHTATTTGATRLFTTNTTVTTTTTTTTTTAAGPAMRTTGRRWFSSKDAQPVFVPQAELESIEARFQQWQSDRLLWQFGQVPIAKFGVLPSLFIVVPTIGAIMANHKYRQLPETLETAIKEIDYRHDAGYDGSSTHYQEQYPIGGNDQEQGGPPVSQDQYDAAVKQMGRDMKSFLNQPVPKDFFEGIMGLKSLVSQTVCSGLVGGLWGMMRTNSAFKKFFIQSPSVSHINNLVANEARKFVRLRGAKRSAIGAAAISLAFALPGTLFVQHLASQVSGERRVTVRQLIPSQLSVDAFLVTNMLLSQLALAVVLGLQPYTFAPTLFGSLLSGLFVDRPRPPPRRPPNNNNYDNNNWNR